MIPAITWTEPVLCHYNYDLSKAWFVHFDIVNEGTGEKKRIQKRGGINHYKNREDRLKAGNALRKFWKEKLENGWSPFGEIKGALVFPTTPLNDAIDFALSKCDVAGKTLAGYRGTVRFFKKAATELGLSRKPVKEIDRQHILLLLERIRETRKWSNHAYNKHLGYFCAILGRLVKWNALKYNPAEKIDALPTVETQKFVPYTAEEKKAIQEHLFAHHYRFFVYLMVIYHTGIRPKEVLALQVKDINLKRATITIQPDIERENSKTRGIRVVPINQHLLPFFKQMELGEYPPYYFVFGSPFASGLGNRGAGSSEGGVKGTMHPDYFKPSPTAIKRDTVTRKWKAIVKDHLKIDKYQYAMKHTGADDKILAGIDLDALKELYGHSSRFMTEKYARKVKQVYRAQIMEQSPAF